MVSSVFAQSDEVILDLSHILEKSGKIKTYQHNGQGQYTALGWLVIGALSHIKARLLPVVDYHCVVGGWGIATCRAYLPFVSYN